MQSKNLPRFHRLNLLRLVSKTGVLPLFEKVGKSPPTLMFWVSSVFAGMKTRTPNEAVHVDLSRNWKFQLHLLNSINHYSWTICRKRVCKYSLERYKSYLHLLCRIFLRNLYGLRSAASFVTTAHSRQILSKGAKLKWKSCRFDIQPQSERIMSYASFPIHIVPLVSSQTNLTLAPQPNHVSKFLAEFCTSTLLSSRYNLGSAYLSKSCKCAWENWESTYEFDF
jgi:hypothetical protein